MPSNPYSNQSISGFNASPPPDDGTQVTANKVEWAKHLNKLANPVKTLAEAINTAVLSAFGNLVITTQVDEENAIIAYREYAN